MSKRAKKIILIILLLALVITALTSGVTKLLTLENLQNNLQSLRDYIEVNYGIALIVYFTAYVIATSISLPGATILTLAAGALFGFWQGLLLVSFASTLGATLACVTSRFLLRDWVENKFRKRLLTINDGLKQEGLVYLLTLRLIPLFPFFVINLALGLTSMPIKTFYWVSQLGMLPGTAVYVNAGTALNDIQEISDIMSPKLLFSFLLIGIFPIIVKALISKIKANKLYRPYSRPGKYDYNLIVIGAGAAGLVTSYIAAALKAKVALIEKHQMGGDCLNTGCVPSKALIRSTTLLHYSNRAKEFGFNSINIDYSFSDIMERVQNVIAQVAPHDSVERYTELGVECIQGNAQILSPFEVSVNGKNLSTRNIVVATGARPLVPKIPGLDSVQYLTSDSIWQIRELPKRLVVVGGGPIGCELTQCFNRLGSEVTQIEAYDCVLFREDKDVSDLVCEQFVKEGVKVLTKHRASRVEVDNGRQFIICNNDGKETKVEFDTLLLALGRTPNVTGFGLEELGVKLSERKTLATDEFLRTNFPNIYAAGDVAGPYQFTHFAAHQAWYAAVNSLFSPFKKFRADYSIIPWCTYTDPEVAHVGLNEVMAQKENIEYEVSKFSLEELDRAIADSETQGFVKVLTAKGKDSILGVTIVGYHAGDLIAEFVLAMKYGLGLNKLLGTIHIYPTMSEANKYVSGVWKKAHAPEPLLSIVERFNGWRKG